MRSFLTLVTFSGLLAGQFVHAAALPDNSGAIGVLRGRQAPPANPVNPVTPPANSVTPPAPPANPVPPQVLANVSSTIAMWLGDIEIVNNFVDSVKNSLTPAGISAQAATAFVAAQNEGASLAILKALVTLNAAGMAAALALPAQFAIIGPAINDTIFNPQNVQNNLNAINGARCPPPHGDAIAMEGAVQMSAAAAVGLASSPPPVPLACFL